MRRKGADELMGGKKIKIKIKTRGLSDSGTSSTVVYYTPYVSTGPLFLLRTAI